MKRKERPECHWFLFRKTPWYRNEVMNIVFSGTNEKCCQVCVNVVTPVKCKNRLRRVDGEKRTIGWGRRRKGYGEEKILQKHSNDSFPMTNITVRDHDIQWRQSWSEKRERERRLERKTNLTEMRESYKI